VGFLFFAMEQQEFRLALAEGIDTEEVNALLDKEGFYFKCESE
jgi:hypothetical protein